VVVRVSLECFITPHTAQPRSFLPLFSCERQGLGEEESWCSFILEFMGPPPVQV
jgi:hypothetical protein